jgi:late competence protein required for DNA uptake (superfamily II DNA/RNA helicase)
MINYKTSNFVNYREKISESIFNWSLGRDKVLNLVSPPYNSVDILLKTILSYVSKGKKVLYVTGESEGLIQITGLIKRYSDFRGYAYVRNNFIPSNTPVHICNYISALRIREEYDLVIYDDINSFPEYNNYEIIDLIIKCLKESGKGICLSVEEVFKNSRDIFVPIRSNKRPLPEPRYIITRIDLNKEIPYLLYDYLNFSVESNRKVVIYLPDSERVHSVYSYLSNLRNSLGKNIMYFINGESDEKLVDNFTRIKKAILITDDYKERSEMLEDTDIIVYFADDTTFDYKNLVYFCGKAGRSDKLRSSEVVFLANSESYDMDKAKNIIRHFNKEAWEMGLLNI